MAGILGCYAIVLKIVVRPASGSAAWRWFLNSAAGSAGLSWHGGFWSLARLGQWLRMTLNIFVSFGGSFNSPAPWPMSGALLPAARLALLAAAVIAAAGLLRLKKERRVVALACVLWLAVYGAFFTSWEPYTMVYRVGDLIPFMTLLYLGLSEPRMGAWSGAALAVLLGAANFSAEIYPRSFSTNNPDLQRMLFIKAHTSGSDWVTGSGGEDELYLPYFAQRRPLVLGQFESRPEELDRLVTELLRSGQGVYATSRSLSEPAWASFFARWKPQPAATDGAGFTLYRLASPR
jgi:hypothetical protein